MSQGYAYIIPKYCIQDWIIVMSIDLFILYCIDPDVRSGRPKV